MTVANAPVIAQVCTIVCYITSVLICNVVFDRTHDSELSIGQRLRRQRISLLCRISVLSGSTLLLHGLGLTEYAVESSVFAFLVGIDATRSHGIVDRP